MTDVAFISRQRVIGRTNGSSVYLLDLAKAIRDAGMTPHLLQPSPTIMGRTPWLWLSRDLDVFATHEIRGVLKLGRAVLSLDPALYAAVVRALIARIGRRCGIDAPWTRDRPKAYSVAIPWSEADRAFIRRASRGRADVAIADYMFQAAAFAWLDRSDVPTAIVMHDLFHARAASSIAGDVADTVALVDRAEEIALLGRADAVIAIQQREADFVAEHVPGVTVITAPIAASCVTAAAPGDGDRLLFVGSNTAPNIVGLQWFFDAVWPAVRAARPAMRLDVAGTVARAFGGAVPPGVRFLGLVDDLDALYRMAGIVISPLTFGSGLKIKLIEAMARGKAIVATPITLQGVEHAATMVSQADLPNDFAGEILRLAGDPAARAQLAADALALARRDFSPAACYAPLLAWLRETRA